MKRVMSYYGKHILSILLLVAILVVQVKFELMLPKCTSDIVNVGIQQGGLKESTPRVIDEKTYGVLLSITKVGYKGKIASSYERWEPESDSQENKK
ncbi:MAG: ABC transporter ATP-binding protein, partial [Peptostreptococcus sp.]|nr:ABC transporter ATP-binding protein [Peptostreptococcus sp.]